MKSLKQAGIGMGLLMGIFFVLWHSSCSKNGCANVTCINFGTCSGGICTCDSGTGGNNCDIVYRTLYANTYTGSTVFTFTQFDTSLNKTHADNNNTLVFSYGTDTSFDKMQVIWNDSNSKATFPIMLSNNNATGSVFTVDTPVTVGNYRCLTGSGTVSTTSASMTLLLAPMAGGLPVTVVMSNFTK